MDTRLSVLTKILGSESEARRIIRALAREGWLCVPIVPTEKMLREAYWSAHEENAAGVWEEMCKVAAEGN